MKGKKMKKKAIHCAKAGFTLIEILLVVIIIGILVGAAMPKLSGHTRRAEIARAKQDIKNIGLAISIYELHMGEYPPSLNALITNPGGDKWSGPYMESGIPTDPWGREYIYARSDSSYTLKSLGPDGQDNESAITN
jgi:general secretion pathway protein G